GEWSEGGEAECGTSSSSSESPAVPTSPGCHMPAAPPGERQASDDVDPSLAPPPPVPSPTPEPPPPPVPSPPPVSSPPSPGYPAPSPSSARTFSEHIHNNSEAQTLSLTFVD
ncbi:hypothetical protein OTU49_003591, partial [Cherax quadricarinatus]